MTDRISRYRTIRLVIHVPPSGHERAPWSLIATTVRAGVPSAQILLDGTVPLHGPRPGIEEIMDALDAALRQGRLM